MAGFHCRNDDWILPHKLRVYSEFCDRIIVILDRSPQSEEICRRFPKVDFIHWTPTRAVPDRDEHGTVCCEEGAMRQAAWDRCAALNPKFVLLGDADEIPTPDIVDWLADPDPSVDCWYFDLVNLWGSDRECIVGGNIYSHLRRDNNKRGAAIRFRPGREYRYRTDAICHVRLEPSPVSEHRAVFDATRRLVEMPKLVHYKWFDLERWRNSAQAQSEKYRGYLANLELAPVPESWIWKL